MPPLTPVASVIRGGWKIPIGSVERGTCKHPPDARTKGHTVSKTIRYNSDYTPTAHPRACKAERTWNTLCAVYPEATTAFIARETAARCRITVTEVFASLARDRA